MTELNRSGLSYASLRTKVLIIDLQVPFSVIRNRNIRWIKKYFMCEIDSVEQ